MSMDRGCVCCSLRNDIVKALQTLQSRSHERGHTYDNILLETTGLADPAPVAFTFFSNAWISSNFRLDSILCLVDAQHVARHLEDGMSTGGDVNEAVSQIAFADIILLNKIDLVSEDQLEKARDLVRSINVTADLIEVQLVEGGGEQQDRNTRNGRKPKPDLPSWNRLMGINSFSIERAKEVDPDFMDSDSCAEGDHDQAEASDELNDHAAEDAEGEGRDHKKRRLDSENRRTSDSATTSKTIHIDGSAEAERDNNMPENREPPSGSSPAPRRQPRRRRKKLHDLSGVGSIGITALGPLDKYRFNAFMRDLLSDRARDIFRSKGVLCIKGQEKLKFVFQGVHETICFGPAASGWPEGQEPLNQIVFIGRNLPRADLVEGFRSCVWVPLPQNWSEYFDPARGQPYYVNHKTGEKRWDRPNPTACALVKASHESHAQPEGMQPPGSRVCVSEESDKSRTLKASK